MLSLSNLTTQLFEIIDSLKKDADFTTEPATSELQQISKWIKEYEDYFEDIVQKNSAKYVRENLESLRKIISRIKLNIKNQEECEALGGASSDVCSMIRMADDEGLTLKYNYNDFSTSNCSSSVVSIVGLPECLFTTLLEKSKDKDKVSLNIPMTKAYLEDAIKVIQDYSLTNKSKLEEEIVVSMAS